MAYWLDSTKVGHEDKSVRKVTYSDGSITYTAHDPDSPASMFCLPCEEYIHPIVKIQIIDREQWERLDGDNGEPFCPACWETDLYVDEYDATRERDARALDLYNDYLFEARKDARLFGE